MDITAEKYYDDNLENYNLLNKIDPLTAEQAMEMMEGYHQAKLKLLGIGGVSQQRQELMSILTTRVLKIQSEPNGIVRETMINNLLVDINYKHN